MIFKNPLLIEIILFAILVAVLNYIATIFHLYWSVSWFDILMHFLGGFLIGLMALYLFFISGYIKFPSTHKVIIFTIVISSVLVVGLTWELWELFAGLTNILLEKVDTIMDIIMDIIGAVAAYYYGRDKIWLEN